MPTTPAVPRELTLTMLHDGRMLWQTLSARHFFAPVESHVEARADNEDIVRGLLDAQPASRTRWEAYAGVPGDFRAGYFVSLSGINGRDTVREWGLTSSSERVLAEGIEPGAGEEATDRLAAELALAVEVNFTRLQNLARERLAGGVYREVLEAMLHRLQSIEDIEEQEYYDRHRRGMGAILRSEQYLLLAEDPEARALYSAITQQEAELYQWYMQLAKGGNAMPR